MSQFTVGIIGGTGLSDLLNREAGGRPVEINTPYGPPSAPFILAEWEGVRIAFLSRHGEGHRLNPSHVPYRANIWALKSLGVSVILASGATGSLREDIEPGQLVICDQVIDKTFRRAGTFFDEGVVAHVEFADPFCPWLRAMLSQTGPSIPATVHHAGTYVCMEGPQFSTRAESNMHRLWGGDLIGMTCMPEAKLAREAEMCYALIALPTDYDCWRPPDPHRGENELLKEIRANLNRASEMAACLIRHTLARLPDPLPPCHCRDALRLAVWSSKEHLPADVRQKLHPLLGRQLSDKTE